MRFKLTLGQTATVRQESREKEAETERYGDGRGNEWDGRGDMGVRLVEEECGSGAESVSVCVVVGESESESV